jgi:hypothetical protein
MPAEGARGCKFTQLMTYHVLGNVDRDMSPAIVNCNGMTHHLWEYGACATPGSNDLLVATLIHILHTLEQLRLNEGAFL